MNFGHLFNSYLHIQQFRIFLIRQNFYDRLLTNRTKVVLQRSMRQKLQKTLLMVNMLARQLDTRLRLSPGIVKKQAEIHKDL